MARKHNNRQQNSDSDEKRFNGFLNIVFNDKERLEVNAWIEARSLSVHDCIVDIAERGFKTSISFDSRKDVWYFSFTGKRTNTIYDGYCVTLSHRDFEKAVFIGAYVVEVLLENGGVAIPGSEQDLEW